MTSDEIIYTAYDALAELGGVPFDKRQFVDRFKALDRGLPSEDEFIALSVWMGNCEIIHKLDQRGYPEDFKNRYEIPDLLAVYRYNDISIPVLIQVKKINLARPESITQQKLKFSEKYSADNKNHYANLTNDLSSLGVILATRIDLEDQLIAKILD